MSMTNEELRELKKNCTCNFDELSDAEKDAISPKLGGYQIRNSVTNKYLCHDIRNMRFVWSARILDGAVKFADTKYAQECIDEGQASLSKIVSDGLYAGYVRSTYPDMTNAVVVVAEPMGWREYQNLVDKS